MIFSLHSPNNTHAVKREIKDEKGVLPRFLVLVGYNMTFSSTYILFSEEFVHINIQHNLKIITMLVLVQKSYNLAVSYLTILRHLILTIISFI
jgi:uncharacterized membrane protein